MTAEPSGVRLLAAEDWHFPWLGGAAPMLESSDLTLPPGGVASMEVIDILHRVHRLLREDHGFGQYLIVCGEEVGGLCGYKHAPSDGEVEVGYGVAPSRQGRGLATQAIAELIQLARSDPTVASLRAETTPTNAASIRVLERNGFAKVGERMDAEDGRLFLWRLELGS